MIHRPEGDPGGLPYLRDVRRGVTKKVGAGFNLSLQDADFFGGLWLRLPRLLQSPQHVLRTEGQFVNSHAGGVVDGVGDAGHRRNAGDFAGAFGAVGAGGVAFDQGSCC